MEQTIQFSMLEKHIAMMTLNRPEKANSLSAKLLSDIQCTIRSITQDERIRCLLVTGAGTNVFCAGADLKERLSMTEIEAKEAVLTIQQTFTAIEHLSIPTLAVINGHALGGGLELALACDIRIAKEEAKLGLPETGLAIIPGAGGTQRLPRLIGSGKAKELIYTGATITAKEAKTIGLIEHVSSSDALLNDALQLAEKIAVNGPIALREAKKAINSGRDQDIQSGLALEYDSYLRLFSTEDRIEGLKAFQEKRSPQYKGK
ncbi:enoyl-CoA hydratase [Bacillus sp. NPDC077027]|uniref:enoyl-CoA hydratase n=1 Tax=Bacillus sp. NPDC077027 TaxID=3390548 RepID=UPI003D0871F0